jgi:hypothetical protein
VLLVEIQAPALRHLLGTSHKVHLDGIFLEDLLNEVRVDLTRRILSSDYSTAGRKTHPRPARNALIHFVAEYGRVS